MARDWKLIALIVGALFVVPGVVILTIILRPDTPPAQEEPAASAPPNIQAPAGPDTPDSQPSGTPESENSGDEGDSGDGDHGEPPVTPPAAVEKAAIDATKKFVAAATTKGSGRTAALEKTATPYLVKMMKGGQVPDVKLKGDPTVHTATEYGVTTVARFTDGTAWRVELLMDPNATWIVSAWEPTTAEQIKDDPKSTIGLSSVVGTR